MASSESKAVTGETSTGTPYGVSYVVLATLTWGSVVVLLKVLLETIPPIPLTMMRFLLGGLVFLASDLIGTRKGVLKLAPRDLFLLIFLVILPLDLSALSLVWGLGLTSATKSGFIGQMSTVFLTAFSFILLRERLRITKLIAFFSAFTGASLMLTGGDIASLISPGYNQGDLIVLMSSFFWALYLMGLKPFLQNYGTSTIGALTFLLGGLALVPWGLLNISHTLFTRFDLAVLTFLLVSSILAINGGNFFYYRAIRTLDLSIVATVSNLAPLVSTLFAFAILGELEILRVPTLVGGALVLAGTVLAATRSG